MSNNHPLFILFAQHGWADTNQPIQSLVQSLAPSEGIIAPNLGWLKTWWSIEPLIKKVEDIAIATLQKYPNTPWRIIGHSMGGLIWVELLHRHPEWRSRVHSLVLVASPIGGSDLGYLLDVSLIGLGIAKDLSTNRREMVEEIAAEIPTLAIAGDIDGGSDGTVIIGATQCDRIQFITIPVSHPKLKNHPRLISLIQTFWSNPIITFPPKSTFKTELIRELRFTGGVFDAHPRDFPRSQIVAHLPEGITLRTWKNPLNQLQHIFLGDRDNQCIYSAFVSWEKYAEFQQKLTQILDGLN
ncbi:alpha/beta fold hydrolase [Spirulina sp. 06S082]|uniref:alpha/beta fold hydrolase n=1 Tax=Spirulina sp. 06S082 TaxID=3110248 RepID=UPI002B1F679E|nr:alpha/beta fold hydrolase [Spirulina sp. 06S082]MEA5471486.1 alpha/beta fold hydrolase [Spirulina sp. 06S082]